MSLTIEITNDITVDEPLAYLVIDPTGEERVFELRADAEVEADGYCLDDEEDWPIFPLWPGQPLGVNDLSAGKMFAVPASDRETKQAILRDWLDNEFRAAVRDDEEVLIAAGVLKIAHEAGEPPVDAVRKCIAAFVRQLIDPAGSQPSTLNSQPSPTP